MPTKLQALNANHEPRVVFVSLAPGDFSSRVGRSLRGKLNNRRDKNGRLLKVLEDLAGANVRVVPWETTPTDVVVLYSDEYVGECTDPGHTAGDAAKPLLNYLLRKAVQNGFSVWFGVAHNTPWQPVVVEGQSLAQYACLLHRLLPDYRHFDNRIHEASHLDDDTRHAAEVLIAHDQERCDWCQGRGPAAPEGASADAAAQHAEQRSKPGLFARIFGGR